MTELTSSWVPVPAGSDFPLQNLPYGIFETPGGPARAGVAIGAHILDLAAVAAHGLLPGLPDAAAVFAQPHLNAFMALGRPAWRTVRQRLMELLAAGNPDLPPLAARVLVPQAEARMRMPFQVGNYTDFYSSLEHATNVGKLFRPDNPLMPNWRHLPVAYHARASSIVVSGTDFHRPSGQRKAPDAEQPVFGPSQRMDFELETAFVIGPGSTWGRPVPVAQAEEHIFGLVLFNDWSARDLQAWEYQPLGPFLGKNFASSVSPWVVTLEALEPFRTAGPPQEPPVLPYLHTAGPAAFDIRLEVALRPAAGTEHVVCRSNFKHLYWNMAQQLAHHTSNGCNLLTGDLLASGTISGPGAGSYGSLLEQTAGGRTPLVFADGTRRTFLEDHDTVTLRGHCQRNGLRIGFGEVSGTVLPAL